MNITRFMTGVEIEVMEPGIFGWDRKQTRFPRSKKKRIQKKWAKKFGNWSVTPKRGLYRVGNRYVCDVVTFADLQKQTENLPERIVTEKALAVEREITDAIISSELPTIADLRNRFSAPLMDDLKNLLKKDRFPTPLTADFSFGSRSWQEIEISQQSLGLPKLRKIK